MENLPKKTFIRRKRGLIREGKFNHHPHFRRICRKNDKVKRRKRCGWNHEFWANGKSFNKTMIHKFVLCIYALFENQSWITLELCIVENFHPNHFFFLFLEPWRAETKAKQFSNTCYDIEQQRNSTESLSHGVFDPSFLCHRPLSSFSCVIDEVCVENLHENEIKVILTREKL